MSLNPVWDISGLGDPAVRTEPCDAWPVAPGGRGLALRFNAAEHEGRPVRIFALASLQPRPHDAPVMVLVHGGGGTVQPFARWRVQPHLDNGFSVLGLDLPGKGDLREASRSGGPDMVYRNMFWKGDLRGAYLWHAVAAVRRLLDAAHPLGIPDSGVMLEGWSWGAVVSLLAAAADPRIAGVAAVYGAGRLRYGSIGRDVARIPDEARQRWRAAFDPACQTYRPDLAVYLMTAANDAFFALPDNVATRMRLACSHVQQAIAANMNHDLPPAMHEALTRFAASARNTAIPWLTIVTGNADDARMRFKLEGAARVAKAELFVADRPVDAAWEEIAWPELVWHSETAAVTERVVTVPRQATADRIWFVNVTADSGLVTSSSLYCGDRGLADLEPADAAAAHAPPSGSGERLNS